MPVFFYITYYLEEIKKSKAPAMYFYVITKISNLNAQTQKYLYLAPLEKNLHRFSYSLTDCIFGGGIEKLRKMPGLLALYKSHIQRDDDD